MMSNARSRCMQMAFQNGKSYEQAACECGGLDASDTMNQLNMLRAGEWTQVADTLRMAALAPLMLIPGLGQASLISSALAFAAAKSL